MGKKYLGDGFVIGDGGTVEGVYFDNEGMNKDFAVIAKCGRCGDDCYVPIMFTRFVKDMKAAVEVTKNLWRVKSNKNDVILAAFGITHLDSLFIRYINEKDPYLKNRYAKDSPELQERRVVEKFNKNYNSKYADEQEYGEIKTRESYDYSNVLERIFAPYYLGDNLVFPSPKVNKDELLHEFYRCKTHKYGICEGDFLMLAMYYEKYGKDNDLGITVSNDGVLSYVSEYGVISVQLPEDVYRNIVASMPKNNNFDSEFESNNNYSSAGSNKKSSQIEKFNKRWGFTDLKSGKSNKRGGSMGSTPGQMGE